MSILEAVEVGALVELKRGIISIADSSTVEQALQVSGSGKETGANRRCRERLVSIADALDYD